MTIFKVRLYGDQQKLLFKIKIWNTGLLKIFEINEILMSE